MCKGNLEKDIIEVPILKCVFKIISNKQNPLNSNGFSSNGIPKYKIPIQISKK